jgi:hypothetical protein
MSVQTTADLINDLLVEDEIPVLLTKLELIRSYLIEGIDPKTWGSDNFSDIHVKSFRKYQKVLEYFTAETRDFLRSWK